MAVAGPLTTTFRAPSSCATATAQLYQVWSGADSSYVQGPLYTADSDCFPSGYDPAPTNYYSPGWCPHGYSAACSSLASVSTETETAVICCPTQLDYTCPAPTAAPDGQSEQQLVLGCTTTWTSALAVLPGVAVVTDGTIDGTTAVSETAGGVTAYGIQVRFRSGDPTPAPTTGDADISILSRTSAPTTPIPTHPLTPAQPSRASSGLSTPAAIGIGVGSAAAALLAVGTLGAFLLRRRRRRRRRKHTSLSSPPSAAAVASSSSSSSSTPSLPPPPVPPKELSASPIPPTCHGVPPPYELSEDTSPRRHSAAAAAAAPKGPGPLSPLSSPSSPLPPPPPSSSSSSPSPPRRDGGRGDSDVLGCHKPRTAAPVELDAAERRAAAAAAAEVRRDRSSPESQGSGSTWTERQARGTTMPTPWI